MPLSARKERIIQAVVDSYITSCEPISSAEIRDGYLPALSGATIRNELSALMEMGYLEQPHTSSGRIPTARAYRLYIEKLMPDRALTDDEIEIVKKHFNQKLTEIDQMLRSAAKVITEITNLTSVAYAGNIREAVIDSVKLVRVTPQTSLVVIVTDHGILKEATADVSADTDDNYFDAASRFITSAFKGRRIVEAESPDEIISQVTAEYVLAFEAVLKILRAYAKQDAPSAVVLEGSSKILEQPEYADTKKARAMLQLLESKEHLLPVLDKNGSVDLSVNITKEDGGDDDLPECAIVTMNLNKNGVNLGKAGVIGPIRMDYSKVASVLSYIGNILEGK